MKTPTTVKASLVFLKVKKNAKYMYLFLSSNKYMYLQTFCPGAVCGENDDDNDDTQELIVHCCLLTHCLP